MKPKKSRGEKLFDWAVYGGLNGVGTFILTIPMAYWAKHGGGARYLEEAGAAMENINISADKAKPALLTTALSLGGTVMLIPIRMAEGVRTSIVNNLNRLVGDKTDAATVAKEVPPQTWGSLLFGRALAWTSVYASFLGVGALAKAAGKPQMIDQFEERFSKILVGDVLKKPLVDAAGQETRAFRLGKFAALDLFATTAATILLYAGSRFAAKRREMRQEKKHLPPPSPAFGIFRDQAEGDAPPTLQGPSATISGDKVRASTVAPEAAVQLS